MIKIHLFDYVAFFIVHSFSDGRNLTVLKQADTLNNFHINH